MLQIHFKSKLSWWKLMVAYTGSVMCNGLFEQFWNKFDYTVAVECLNEPHCGINPPCGYWERLRGSVSIYLLNSLRICREIIPVCHVPDVLQERKAPKIRVTNIHGRNYKTPYFNPLLISIERSSILFHPVSQALTKSDVSWWRISPRERLTCIARCQIQTSAEDEHLWVCFVVYHHSDSRLQCVRRVRWGAHVFLVYRTRSFSSYCP